LSIVVSLCMNYKQILLSLVTFSLAVYIPLVTAYAQEASSSSANAMPTSVDYQLPYPGLLPDNPLYFLKVFRDNLTAVFLSKPLDKAKFDLLQSDKKVEASYLLVTQQQGKTVLAAQTFSQAQDEFAAAITQTANAKKQGYSVQEISKNLENAHQKHVQMLHALEQQTGQKDSQTFQKMRNREAVFTKTLMTLR